MLHRLLGTHMHVLTLVAMTVYDIPQIFRYVGCPGLRRRYLRTYGRGQGHRRVFFMH